jgi:hypothetical protein
MMKALLIILSAVLFLPNIINKDINSFPAYNKIEDFNPQLAYINSSEKLEQYIDSSANTMGIAVGSFEYVQLAETLVKQRFYHGFSHFSLSENWIASISGRLFKEDFACKVKPEDIMLHQNAACSQQSIVMMALLRKKNLDYRKVGFPHHYAMEVMVDKNWFFFDPDMEPVITKEQRIESNWKLKPDLLKQYYDPKRYSDLDYKFGIGQTVTTGAVNEVPAGNVKKFHTLTYLLSKILWCLPLLLLYFRPSFSPSFVFRVNRRNHISLAH